MKTLKSIMLGLALLVAGTVANAANKPTPAALTKNEVLNIYINAVVHGKTEGLNEILDDNIQYIMTRGSNVTTLNKKRILASFKASENIEQDCKYITTIIEDTREGMIVKLELQYGGYVRTNLITISLNRPDWKITKIENVPS
ncbi:hypothetical protein [Mucilaginibacter sp.]|uniref:hypothetical protein n=1 Tax=Mucilaginibacter sp. TaxID=1882438 RepID=UPI00260968BB|nr:hypothetical protein [Mucilaginibacter sp.]MDB5029537.1 hypothetical protein [Mucilaginibacter sp.]